MIKTLFCVRDELIGYGDPFAMPGERDDLAKRAFTNAVNAEEPNSANQNPEDKVLFRLARYDDQSGEITPCKEQICRATEVLK